MEEFYIKGTKTSAIEPATLVLNYWPNLHQLELAITYTVGKRTYPGYSVVFKGADLAAFLVKLGQITRPRGGEETV